MATQAPAWLDSDAAGRHATLAEILARVSLEASQGDTLDEVLKHIVDCLVARLPVAIASIILLNEEGTHFLQEVYAGDMDLAPPADGAWPVSLGASGRCVRTGEPQLIVNPADDPDYVPGNAAVQSEYLVPIRHRGELLGVLNLESKQRDFFTPAVRDTFDAVAGQVAGSISLARVVRQLEQANRRLQQVSLQDGLTGIANRRRFDEVLAQAWQVHAATQQPLALVMIDVDHFKELNDASGHVFADQCLRDLANECARLVRDADDLVARYGGEEFVILLPGCESRQAAGIGERLRANVESLAIPHPGSPMAACVTVSVGVASMYPTAGQAPERLTSRADRAMYAAKHRGRNRVMRDA